MGGPGRTMQIFARIAAGRTLVLHVEPWFTGRDMKAMIWWRAGIPVEFMWLSAGSHAICDAERLEDRNVGPDSTVWVHIRAGK